ncbi:MAG: hypothetical protein R2706_01225 [Acidimicrobiales bacterium]
MRLASGIDPEEPPIVCSIPARVGLLGNPSDGYGGRTIGLAVRHFEATVSLQPCRGIQIMPSAADALDWGSPGEFARHIDRYGVGNGAQAVAAAARTFLDVLDSLEYGRCDGFSLSYATTIPRQVGLAGSSALILATLMCLEEHSGLSIPRDVLPSIALAAEVEQLGIAAGLQDRVVQTYGGLVAMDFSELEVDARFGVRRGTYRHLDPANLPPLFLAYSLDAAEPSGIYHQSLRHRFDHGDAVVRSTMRQLAGVAVEGEAALRWGNADRFSELIGRNMELRRLLGTAAPKQEALVDIAESLGAFATFAARVAQ